MGILPLLALCAPAGCARSGTGAPLPAAALTFAAEGKVIAEVGPAELVRMAPPVEVAMVDPLYHRLKRFRALPLAALLEKAFPPSWQPLASHDFLLRAKDGFSVPIAGARLLEEGAYVAFADLDAPAWEPIGQTHANPAPFYLVWTKPDQQLPEDHPRPYQLARIEIASVEQVFPHLVPSGAPPDSPVTRGFTTFRNRCLPCHAINREGGRVGPELNVPQSIVEYRPVPQIKAYIRNPLQFRYGHMPSHPDLTESNLDELIAYFDYMKSHKYDPDAAKPADPPK